MDFDVLIDAGNWPTGCDRDDSQGQMRVDQIQAALRSAPSSAQSAALQGVAAPMPRVVSLADSDRLLGEELMRVRAMIDSATADLSEDMAVLMRHEKALQTCDIAAAILEILARVMAAPDRAAAVAAVEMHEVRTRLSGNPAV